MLWRDEWKLDVELVHSIDEVLARTQGSNVDEALRAALEVRIGGEPSGSRRIIADEVAVFVSLSAGAERNPELCDLAVSFDAELLCDERVVASSWGVPISRGELAHPEHPASAAPPGFELRLRVGPIPAADADEPTRRARWSLRLKSNAAGALALWDAKRYWKGELSLPLDDALASYASAIRSE
ncbi:MAG: hypothetical protein HZA52_18190 [Planctomycetes bacterium]|nr:hypothetical protein [Planctomycetota bacterium]